jgi:short subunit dehydrogenase-like uncharacterized protein
MSVQTAGRTHLVLVGATGMVGGYALRYALEHPAVERVTAIGRRTLGISHAKLNTAPKLWRLFRPGGVALASGCSDLLPRRVYRLSVGR